LYGAAMKKILIALLVASVWLPSLAYGQVIPPSPVPKPFVMAMIRPETDYLGKWWRLVYSEMFRRLGIPVEFRDYPGKRASTEIDEGRVDGEPGRIKEYFEMHPQLIRIDEALFPLNFTAFAISPSIPKLNAWADLKGTSYHVAFNRGIRICEINLPKVVAPDKLTSVTDPVQGIKQLAAGHIDLYIDQESGILTLLRDPEFQGKSIRRVGVMERAFVYPYVHKKHADLVPKMRTVLRAMKNEGLIEHYHKQVQKQFGVFDK